jgi:hypothetical protein
MIEDRPGHALLHLAARAALEDLVHLYVPSRGSARLPMRRASAGDERPDPGAAAGQELGRRLTNELHRVTCHPERRLPKSKDLARSSARNPPFWD